MSYYYYNTVLPLLLTTGSPGQGADSLHRDHRPGQHQGQGGHCQVIQQGEQWAPGRLFGYSIINFFRWMVPILAYLTVFTYLLNSLWWGDAAVPGCWRGGAEPGGGQPPLHAGHALEPADGEPGLRQDLQVKVALSWPVMGTVLQEAEAPFLERLPKLFQLWASNFRYCDASF